MSVAGPEVVSTDACHSFQCLFLSDSLIHNTFLFFIVFSSAIFEDHSIVIFSDAFMIFKYSCSCFPNHSFIS